MSPRATGVASRPGSRAGAGAAANEGAIPGTAERFAARVRSRRRRRWATVVAAVLVLAGLAWVVLRSSWLSVRVVTVDGLDRVPAAAVRLVTDAELGRPMVLVDPTVVARRVVAVPLVRSATVERRWPSTIVVHIHERVPVVAVPASGGGALRLLDEDGVEVAQAQHAGGLPVLQVDVATAGPLGPATLRAGLAVLASLPKDLAPKVTAVGASTPDSVWLTLDDGTRVVWGNADAADRKGQVLAVLLGQGKAGRGVTLDVSSPDAPAVSGKR